MCGAFLGPLHAVIASVASLLVGGIIGVVWFFWHFFAAGADYISDDYIADDGPSASSPTVGHQAVPTSAIPYAVAIFVGNLIALKVMPMILPIFNGGISS